MTMEEDSNNSPSRFQTESMESLPQDESLLDILSPNGAQDGSQEKTAAAVGSTTSRGTKDSSMEATRDQLFQSRQGKLVRSWNSGLAIEKDTNGAGSSTNDSQISGTGIFRHSSHDEQSSNQTHDAPSKSQKMGEKRRHSMDLLPHHNKNISLKPALKNTHTRTTKETTAGTSKSTSSSSSASKNPTKGRSRKTKIKILEVSQGSSMSTTPVSLPPPPGPPANPVFISPRTKTKIERTPSNSEEEMPTLPIHLVNTLSTNKADLSTYHAMLNDLAASEKPSAQSALNILATMKHNGVDPDDETWKLIDRCSDLDIKGDSLAVVHQGNDDKDEKTVERLSLYSESKTSTAESGSNRRRSWKVEQDLSQLPPAFRSSIRMMITQNNKKSLANGAASTPLSSLKEPPTETGKPPPSNNKKDASLFSELRGAPSVADRKKRWTSQGKVSMLDQIPVVPPSPSRAPTDDSKESHAAHGVVKYMRPEGKFKPGERSKIARQKETKPVDIADEIANIDTSDLDSYNELLAIIAESALADKANRAGKVLKSMKENSVLPDDNTRNLLMTCSLHGHSPPPPTNKKAAKDDAKDEDDDDGDEHKNPAQTVKKRVRFAEKNSFRIIRRRRSISSMERWDDPLTPPKRMTRPIDLAPSRFSSGLRDDRPSLPRRSDSMSSLLSGGSAGTMSSSDSDDSSERESDRFRLPFSDESPKAKASKKGTITVLRVPRRSSDDRKAPKKRVGGDTPTAPLRRKGSNDDESKGDKNKSSESSQLPPPPPVDEFGSPIITSPPPRRRIRRRSSISGVERRADMPLTPPRRVSAPLEVFLAQASLRNAKAAEAETKSLGSFEESIEKDERTVSSEPVQLKSPKTPKSAKRSVAKPKVEIPSKLDLPISPRKKTILSPDRQSKQLSNNWTTINLPDKIKIRNLVTDSPVTSTRSLKVTLGRMNEEDNIKTHSKSRKASRRSSVGSSTQSYLTPKARDSTFATPKSDSSWSRIKLKPKKKGSS